MNRPLLRQFIRDVLISLFVVGPLIASFAWLIGTGVRP